MFVLCFTTLFVHVSSIAQEVETVRGCVAGSVTNKAFWKALAGCPEFVRTFWQKQPLFLPNAMPPDLVTASDFVDVPRDKFRYTSTSVVSGQAASFLTDTPDTQSFFLDKVKEGRTMILNSFSTHSKGVSLCTEAYEGLGLACNINIYGVYPGRDVGVPAHWDAHETFIYQSQGTKVFRIFEPLFHQSTEMTLGGYAGQELPADLKIQGDVQLAPGDVLYMPRGLPHATSTPAGTVWSLTLTWNFGFEDMAYYRLLACARHIREKELEGGPLPHWSIRRAIREHQVLFDAMMHHERLRRYVPAGFHAQALGLSSDHDLEQFITNEAISLNDLVGYNLTSHHLAAAASIWAENQTVLPMEATVRNQCRMCGRCVGKVPRGIFNWTTGAATMLDEYMNVRSDFNFGMAGAWNESNKALVVEELLGRVYTEKCHEGFETLQEAQRLEPQNSKVLKKILEYTITRGVLCSAADHWWQASVDAADLLMSISGNSGEALSLQARLHAQLEAAAKRS